MVFCRSDPQLIELVAVCASIRSGNADIRSLTTQRDARKRSLHQAPAISALFKDDSGNLIGRMAVGQGAAKEIFNA
jgi:hypothetical protein